MNVLVTGVGGGVGQSIVKSLQGTAYSPIGVDAEVLGTGLYAVDHGYHGHYANHPRYLSRILEICRHEQCALLFPGTDAELPVLAAHASLIQQAETIPVVSSPDVIDLCDDKLATAAFLARHGHPAPITVPFDQDSLSHLDFPFILKPRRGGARSRGVHKVRNKPDLNYYLQRTPAGAYIAQEHIEGPEYTCGSVNFAHRCLAVILLRRVLRDGDTYKAFVEEKPDLSQFVVTVLNQLGPFGPCNVQLRIRDHTPYIIEFNARCSGTTYCRTLAGFNEPLMMANLLLSGQQPQPAIRSLTILRYWKELAVENDVIHAISEKHSTDRPQGRL